MTLIQLTTLIDAPIGICFRLSLSIDLELEAAREYGIQAVGGVTSGVIDLGERVRWRTRQFGIAVTHTSEISRLEDPFYFQDIMIDGVFRSFCHDHYFRALAVDRTEMRDEMIFSMSGIHGWIAERTFVRRRLRQLLTARNRLIKACAEHDRSSLLK